MDCQQHLEELNNFVFNFETIRNQYLSALLNSPSQLQYDFLPRFESYFSQLLFGVSNIQWKVIQCIDYWKKEQQKSIVSGILDSSMLNCVEHCNTKLLRLYQLILDDFNKFLQHHLIQSSLNLKSKFINFIGEVNKLIDALLQNSFLVLEQPCSSILKHDPLSIISNAKFDVKLCFLINLDNRIVPNNVKKSLEIEVRLLKEDEIRNVMTNGIEAIIDRKPSFKIIKKDNPTFSTENQRLMVSMTCMLKVDINRRGHNPKALPVAEEKFKFVFYTRIEVMGREFVLHTFSLPVNVLSRKDYRNSYATIIWDCAFSLDQRKMFEVRDTVEWTELALVLNCKFHKDVGIYLYQEQFDFIQSMLPNRADRNLVTWDQFAKTLLPMRQFTFFEWFYKILILVREQLLQMYCDGLIHGFISSEMAENLLLNCVDGTFLIRFSESFCGAISIAYVKNRKFDKLYPWDLDRLRKISLSHTIKSNVFLLYLYPNIPKDEVFCRHYIHNEVKRSITGKDYEADTNIAQVINQSQV